MEIENAIALTQESEKVELENENLEEKFIEFVRSISSFVENYRLLFKKEEVGEEELKEASMRKIEIQKFLKEIREEALDFIEQNRDKIEAKDYKRTSVRPFLIWEIKETLLEAAHFMNSIPEKKEP